MVVSLDINDGMAALDIDDQEVETDEEVRYGSSKHGKKPKSKWRMSSK